MAIIQQDGFDFIYKSTENYQKIVQRWSIERVAAYMSVIHVVQVKYTRCYSRITYCPKLGMTFYELQNTDTATNRDIDKLTSYRDWETDRKSTRLNSSHSAKSRMPSSA